MNCKNGKNLTPFFLAVILFAGGAAADPVRLSLTSSPSVAWIGEAIDVELRVAIRLPPALAGGTEPISDADPPILSIPSPGDLAGLAGPDLAVLLAPRRTIDPAQPGFVVSASVSDAGLMSSPDPARYRLNRTLHARRGERWLEYVLRISLQAERAGNYAFGPVLFKGSVVIDADNRGRPVGWTSVSARTDAVSIRVLVPPPPDRPDTSFGAVGRSMTAASSMQPQSVRIGEPVEYRLRISGEIDLDRLRAPRLTKHPGVKRYFKIHDQTVSTLRRDAQIEFLYTIRPLQEGLIEFPALELPWFDRDSGRHTLTVVPPLPLRVLPAQHPDPPAGVPPERIEAAPVSMPPAPVPASLRYEPDGWRRDSWRDDPVPLILAGMGPMLYLVSAALGLLTMAVQRMRYRIRRRLAARRFTQRVLEARHRLDASPTALAAGIRDAINHYLNQTLGTTVSAKTPTELWQMLAQSDPPTQPTDRCRQAVGICFQQCYAPHAVTPRDDSPYLTALLEDIPALTPARLPDDRRKPSCVGRQPGWIVFSLLTLLILSAVWFRPDEPHPVSMDQQTLEHLWHETHTLAARANDEATFRQARAGYEELRQAGARNGTLYYNLGTLNLAFGDDEAAIAALRRAVLFDGPRRDLRHNLSLTRSRLMLLSRAFYLRLAGTLFLIGFLIKRPHPDTPAPSLRRRTVGGFVQPWSWPHFSHRA